MTLAESIKRNGMFLGLWLATVVSLTVALCLIDKGALHLLLCDHHSAWGDVVMPVLSDTCNWLPYVAAVGLLIWRWQAGAFVGASLILSTIIAQVLKHLVAAPRPLTWFAEHMPEVTLPLTEGVRMNYYLSFPSGHTTTFFCTYFALCALFTAKSKAPAGVSIIVQVLLFALAAVSSYSRLYLSQHFALDVLAGMLIGVLSVAIVAHFFSKSEKLSFAC